MKKWITVAYIFGNGSMKETGYNSDKSYENYNHGQNILELCNILEKIGFATSKALVDV